MGREVYPDGARSEPSGSPVIPRVGRNTPATLQNANDTPRRRSRRKSRSPRFQGVLPNSALYHD